MPVRCTFGSWSNMLKEIGLTPVKFIPTKNGFTRKGTRNRARIKVDTPNGYIDIFEPSHPTARSNGYCFEHRFVAYNAGILIDLSDVVHHIDENKKNNSIENLSVMANGDHTSSHHKGVKKERVNAINCITAGCLKKTTSKYGLCSDHYKSQWEKVKYGRADKMELLK